MRTPLIAANWKMHKTVAEARSFVEAFLPAVRGLEGADIALCPPFTALAAVGPLLAGSAVALGAQDLYHEDRGAFTGEIAPGMLTELGVRYVIVGHSERRTLFGETDELVRAKVAAAFRHGLTPILCVGEQLAEREAGRTEAVVTRQVEAALTGLEAAQVERLVIAYEPVWAIGTGRAATAADAGAVCRLIRDRIRAAFGDRAARGLRIQYGGSVKADNIADFARDPDIDGALVGGASLDPQGFAALVRAAAEAARGRRA
ncbi:triose-phosphate isomerase [Caldinitratiruptor microaerophilus]|uniref:Triosephosphate isomerase n=1 Tax=Caldinitratiruptor microaerophilus TaxID=671077 RepID=A0AA35CLZ1_9FIRM|nr:triose-phosphate isomerase [Caldinitratiruptor microaerophilus]BDG61582.1 triosephosphate isomerase [Caldinitratiruptor microaerophilus]